MTVSFGAARQVSAFIQTGLASHESHFRVFPSPRPLNTYAIKTQTSSPFSRSPIYLSRIAAIRKAVPADSAHDELSWRNFPRMKSHLSSKPFATGPVTGHSGEVSTPEMSTPPRPLKSGADRHGFPNREAIVRKA